MNEVKPARHHRYRSSGEPARRRAPGHIEQAVLWPESGKFCVRGRGADSVFRLTSSRNREIRRRSHWFNPAATWRKLRHRIPIASGLSPSSGTLNPSKCFRIEAMN